MSETIIQVEKLSKRYVIGHQREKGDALRHALEAAVRHPLQWLRARKQAISTEREEFWALKDVSFDIKRGEVVGIVGRNGAGKSTLLKILSRITEPTRGRVRICGRVASLLEVGTGFHQELTGRENVYLNGAILGMHRAEMKQKFDEIVAFAEVEKFLDVPVKRYSSGMSVRLAFAVAAHLEPEILIVDEVLAVGDVEFQKKCLGKMGEVAKGGRTVLFVSHNITEVMRLCQRGILLKGGMIAAQGSAESVVNEYLRSGKGDESTFIPNRAGRPPGNEIVVLRSVSVMEIDGSTGPTFSSAAGQKVEIVYSVLRPVRGLRIGFHLLGPDGTIIFNTADTDGAEAPESERGHQAGVFSSCCFIPPGFLNYGRYSLTVGSDTPTMINFYFENCISFFIVPAGGPAVHGDNRPGLVCPKLQWEIKSVPQEPQLVSCGNE